MTGYTNLAGNSAITAYEIVEDGLIVEFNGDATYLYNYASAGKSNIEQMKKLAKAGKGLSTFISRFVHAKYAEKLK